ncbi:hypothetical protein [uncultured Dokdonia sp.]|uniref:hypothetical protein n=1 Tax=uncultured Dokdonia sp. TaxID=575653 RepID=UPI0026375B91|nr:hypothetical protein [uncultured Dokdonia sp.]
MEFNNKKLTRTTTFIHYLISFLLAIFLIGLANRIIWDIDGEDKRPYVSDFEIKTDVKKYKLLRESIQDSIQGKHIVKEDVQLSINLTQNALDEQQASFKAWISTRNATRSSKINTEIQQRNYILDSLRTSLKKLKSKKLLIQSNIDSFHTEKRKYTDLVNEEMAKARALHLTAERAYDLQVFLSRLLFVVPVLLLGIWMLVKKRKHSYWPLFRGFVFFAFYAFFIGLVPYLPSYGGYVRYIIGIIVSLLLGIYAIKHLKAFVKKKKEELQLSSSERSNKIKEEVAEKALENHMCPSCGKDYLINEIFQSGKGKKKSGMLKVTTYCRHCGLQLFKNCETCDTKNYAHLPHCYSCGDQIINKIHEQ